MSSIELSEEEARAVLQALDNYLPVLRYELARVKRERDRHAFVVFDEILERLRTRLAEEQREWAQPGV